MRKEFKPAANIASLPVLMIATYNDDGTANVMNAAWGTQYSEDTIVIFLSSHQTTDNLKKRGEFTVSFATKKTVDESDYFGIVSGRKENKVAKTGFHALASEKVNAPLIEEYPLTLECKVEKLIEEDEDSYILYGKVVGVNVDESILTDNKIDVDKLKPLSFSPYDNTYRVLGEVAGKAWGCGLKFR